MASSSSSVHNKSYLYDVFLSFCGVDTRKTFVDHLYAALDQHGIRTFKDDERLEKGKKINDELLQSIEDSRLCIIVFSKNYASSSWCLNELLKIMECHKSNEQTAFPVFYDVDPSEVRKQTGSVGAALDIHKNEAEEVGKWKQALKKAADLSGWDVRKTANGHEAKVIKLIVECVSLELRYINMDVDENLVGMEKRMQDLDSCLEISTDDHVRMIGIKGKGGAGKTTLVWAIFNKIFMNFECQSFVENVKDKAKIGLEKLQEQVLRDVLKDKNITVNGLHEGENLMKNKLRGKKVLLVLDDVDDINQLKMLAGDTTWFKPGSRILVTTRDEQVLEEHKVILIHDVSLLLEEEAIYLFSRHAFGKDILTQEYEMLSRDVSCADGLPLTIKVLGSKLYGKDNEEWEYTLERLKSMRSKEILAKLELSYESLEDHHKDIFLDVACFLKGWKKEDAIRMLESCRFHAKYGLRVLEQKSLIVTEKSSYGATIIDMHDHLVEMGKNIVRREHPNEPEKHSRLWIQEEIKHDLAGKSGSEVVRCIDLEITPGIYVKGLANLKKLRCLIVNHERYNFSHDGPWYFFGRSWKHEKARRCFPSSLQYLHWEEYPYWCLPETFEANNLVTLVMPRSKIKQLWEGEKVMKNLKYLKLSHSKKLRSLDLGMTPNLERLSLTCCEKLVNVDVYGGCLKSLVALNLYGCYRLKSISFIKQFESLEVLNVSYLKLKKFPEYITTGHSINSLQELNLSRNKDIEIPSSIENLHNLKTLNLSETDIEELPEEIGQLECLEYLYLSVTKVKHLPGSICMLKHLKTLHLSWCRHLEKLPKDVGQIESLEELLLYFCRNLREIPNSICNLKCLKQLNLAYCERVEKLPEELGNSKRLQRLEVGGSGITELPQSISLLEGLKIEW